MKHRLYVVSILVLIASLIAVVPVSAGKVKIFNVDFPAEPVAGANWTPSVTINWEGYRASYVGYFFSYKHSDGEVHSPNPGWQMTPVNPKVKGPQTITLTIPGTYIRLDDDPGCWVDLGGGIFDAKPSTIQFDELFYYGVCIDQVP